MVVFTPEKAEAAFARGEKCILVRDDTSPEDVGGMWASQGVLTARGGMTSHAAVVSDLYMTYLTSPTFSYLRLPTVDLYHLLSV